jgi:hypothetical protein
MRASTYQHGANPNPHRLPLQLHPALDLPQGGQLGQRSRDGSGARKGAEVPGQGEDVFPVGLVGEKAAGEGVGIGRGERMVEIFEDTLCDRCALFAGQGVDVDVCGDGGERVFGELGAQVGGGREVGGHDDGSNSGGGSVDGSE